FAAFRAFAFAAFRFAAFRFAFFLAARFAAFFAARFRFRAFRAFALRAVAFALAGNRRGGARARGRVARVDPADDVADRRHRLRLEFLRRLQRVLARRVGGRLRVREQTRELFGAGEARAERFLAERIGAECLQQRGVGVGRGEHVVDQRRQLLQRVRAYLARRDRRRGRGQ